MVQQPEGLQATSLEFDGGVAVLTLDRPGAANARDQRMRDELVRVYDWVESTDNVAALVLTGAGDRVFCAGMDLKEAGESETQLERRERLRRGRDIERLAGLPIPTVAAINGHAVGGGLEMALACDLRVAVETAEVGLPELKHGLMPGAGGTQRLPRLIGYSRAIELILLAERITAVRAAEIGLIHRVVPADDLLDASRRLAESMAAHPRAAVRQAKEALRASLELPLASGLDRELDGLLFLLQNRTDFATTETNQ